MPGRRNRGSIGAPGERLITRELEYLGYIVGSRRHLGGAGDLLAHRSPHFGHPPLLVEVKARLDPWQGFRRDDRAAMIEAGLHFDVMPLLAWLAFPFPKSGDRPRIVWLPVEDWPT